MQTNSYMVVEKSGAEAFQDNGGLLSQRLVFAMQAVSDSCGRSPVELRECLTRLHELQLQPFTVPFVFQIAALAKQMGWLEFIAAAGVQCPATNMVWDATTATQKEALEQELQFHANDEREVAN